MLLLLLFRYEANCEWTMCMTVVQLQQYKETSEFIIYEFLILCALHLEHVYNGVHCMDTI